MARTIFIVLFCSGLIWSRASGDQFDLRNLAERTRASVMLIRVSDSENHPVATGSGFLISPDGQLVTNYHVISGGTTAVAQSENGGVFEVEGLLVEDRKHDLAILKIRGTGFSPLALGTSASLKPGERLAVIGSPLGLEGLIV